MSKKQPLKTIAGAADKPLVIGEIEIPCYVLEDRTRVLSQTGMILGLGMKKGTAKGGGDRLVSFIRGKAIKSFISNELAAMMENPIEFTPPTGGRAYGYPATLLVDICNAVIDARNSNTLQKQQLHIAGRCEILIRGFATIGIIGLVDEVTGYQDIRAKNALAKILEAYLDKEYHKWTRTFPYEFYEQIYRLKGWDGPEGRKRPSVIGRYTNDFVYDRLAPSTLEELSRLNPKNAEGNRLVRHHQWFNPDFGHPKLKEHLTAVTALMRISHNWDDFKRNVQRAFPKRGEQGTLNIYS